MHIFLSELKCKERELQMSLVLPISFLENLHFSALQLNDPTCPVFYNSTHVTATFPLTGCGTKTMVWMKPSLHSYTGAGHIIRISSKIWFISLIPFKKWNLYNVYIHSTQTDIFQVFISFNFDDYNWQLMKTSNSVSQKIRILLKTNTKKGFLEILANWKVWTWKVWACTALNT